MGWSWSPKDPDVGFKAASFLTTWNEDENVALLQWMTAWQASVNESATCYYVRRQDVKSAIYIADTGTRLFVDIEGTSGKLQAYAYSRGAAFPAKDEYGNDVNSVFYRYADNLVAWLQKAGIWRKQPVLFAGHSYGGAVAEIATVLADRVAPGAVIGCVSFGSPRLGDYGFCARFQGINLVRWMTDTDVVPFLPPKPEELPDNFFIAVAHNILFNYPTHMEQPTKGRVIFASGQWVSRAYPNNTPVPKSLGNAWLDACLEAIESSHLIGPYIDRLKLAAAKTPVVLPLPPPVPVTGISGQPLPVGVAAIRPGVQNVAVLEDFEMIADKGTAYVPNQFSAYVGKHGGEWACFLGATPIVIDQTKTKCLTVKKHLNRFLRRLQVVDTFNFTLFQGAIVTYVNESTAGGLGFRPDTHTVT